MPTLQFIIWSVGGNSVLFKQPFPFGEGYIGSSYPHCKLQASRKLFFLSFFLELHIYYFEIT